MKKLRRFSIVLLTMALTALLLTACGGGGGSSPSASSKPTPSSSTPTNPEQPGSSSSKDPSTEPEEYPKTWADSKTKKYLSGKGISETNVCIVFDTLINSSDGMAEVTYSVSGAKAAAESVSAQDHVKSLLKENGEGYYIDYNGKSIGAGKKVTENIKGNLEQAKFLAMLPTDANVSLMNAEDYSYKGTTYYSEIFDINANNQYVWKWRYLYLGNELKYIIAESLYGQVSEIKSISANPPASCFELPKAEWSGEVTRTLDYFKNNNITDQHFYLEGTWSEGSGIISTVNGSKAYSAQTYPNGTEPFAFYMEKPGATYRLYEQQKKYIREEHDEDDIRTGYGSLNFSALTDYISRESTVYQEGTTTYYTETFEFKKDYHTEKCRFVFAGNRLVRIINSNPMQETTITKLEGTPNNELLKNPKQKGYTETSY